MNTLRCLYKDAASRIKRSSSPVGILLSQLERAKFRRFYRFKRWNVEASKKTDRSRPKRAQPFARRSRNRSRQFFESRLDDAFKDWRRELAENPLLRDATVRKRVHEEELKELARRFGDKPKLHESLKTEKASRFSDMAFSFGVCCIETKWLFHV